MQHLILPWTLFHIGEAQLTLIEENQWCMKTYFYAMLHGKRGCKLALLQSTLQRKIHSCFGVLAPGQNKVMCWLAREMPQGSFTQWKFTWFLHKIHVNSTWNARGGGNMSHVTYSLWKPHQYTVNMYVSDLIKESVKTRQLFPGRLLD